MKNVVLSFVLFGILSGQTGKISGLITASETNQPLIGVSVVVEGAGIGADTDQEGRYVILNIPVGEYSLRTSYIGYASVKATNLQVSTGRTTEQNFVLSQEAITGEEVVVLATSRASAMFFAPCTSATIKVVAPSPSWAN